jgi:molybdate transport system ATP-binding protein
MRTETLEVHVRSALHGALVLDLAFQAPPGITILFGPSGAGKTSALATIAGLRRPDAGRIALGDDVWFDAERAISRPVEDRGIAYVFQSLALFPHMTAADNVAYGIERTVPKPARRRRAIAMLERMSVAHLADRRPRTYSGGEAQRVALSRAFARAPRLVLLDEAFSALDVELRRALWSDVRDTIRELAIPAIQVTHLIAEAQAMGDRVILMQDGRVTATGGIDALVAGGLPHPVAAFTREPTWS